MTTTIATWESWQPSDYFSDYFSQQVEPDELAAIPFQVDFLRRSGRGFSRALEYGCGPTLMRAIAAAPYVTSLDMADHLDRNLERVRQWRDGEGDDWTQFTDYILRCEGIAEPSREQVLTRERQARSVMRQFLLTDARERNPLGSSRVASYDLLISSFCVESISRNKAVWRRCMQNIFTMLEPGGSFVILALRGAEAYRVGTQWFPVANIQARELGSVLLECGADPGSLDLAERDLPSHADQGYEGILLASGRLDG